MAKIEFFTSTYPIIAIIAIIATIATIAIT